MEVYLDNGNTTIVPREVVEAMTPFFNEKGYGHPAMIHKPGREALEALEKSREIIGRSINASPEEIVFTSGGTEANNMALKGVAHANKHRGKHIVASKIEHESVLRVLEQLKTEGFKVSYLDVDGEGFVDPNQLEEKITADTILVSVMYVNHEIGTIEPIKEISDVLKSFNHKIYLHTDAAAAYTKVPIDVEKTGIDLLTLSSHKVHGPKGVGALFIRENVEFSPLFQGAISNTFRRPGLENIPGIVGFSKAVELAFEGFEEKTSYMRRLRDKLINGLMSIPYTLLNGPKGHLRSPGNVNVSFLFVEAESIVVMLDSMNIYVSSGSACATRTMEASPTLLAIGRSLEETHGSIMFGLSRYNKEEEINFVLEKISQVVEKLREISPVKPS